MAIFVLITTQKLKVSVALGDLLAGRRLILCLPLRRKSRMEPIIFISVPGKVMGKVSWNPFPNI